MTTKTQTIYYEEPSKKNLKRSKTYDNGSNIHTINDNKTDDDSMTYDQMETLLAASVDKCLLLRDENIDLKAQNSVIEEYLNKAIEQNDTMKIKLSRYEPTNNNNVENKRKINEFKGILSMSEERIKELENKKMDEMKKKHSELYASKFGNRFI